MKSSVKSRAQLTDMELKSFLTVLWKRHEENENYEFAAVLKDISNNFDAINDFVKPGGSKWPKVNVNTPIHSYIDSVGQPTIGWGSTYYDSILNGKKPVKMGDKITKGRADNILSKNIQSLATEYSTKIPNWNKMTDKQKAGLLLLGYNAPYGPLGSYSKLTAALKKGDMRAAAQNVQRGGPSPQRIATERSLLLSGPNNLKNLVGPKMVGPGPRANRIPGIPFLADGGTLGSDGKVKSTTGIDYTGGGADTQYIPPSVMQVGEAVRVFTKRAVDNGILPIVDLFEAILSPDSKAGKQNIAVNSPLKRNIPGPPMRRSRSGSSPITLPPIKTSSGYPKSSGSKGPPEFSTSPSSSIATRNNTAQILGLMA
jgi:GH24 family phage-related lysozyme (muramidase)